MIYPTTDFFEFIAAHRDADPVKLRLKFHGQSPMIELAITHLQCLKKAGRKFIAANGVDFTPRLMTDPLAVEQATSASVALRHKKYVAPGSRVLDMTMGMGIDCTAISEIENVRVTGCEINLRLAECNIYNFATRPNVTVVAGDGIEFLRNSEPGDFDVAFIDPARRGKGGQRVYNLHDCTPDLIELRPEIMAKVSRMIAKLSPMLDIKQTLADLPGISNIVAVDDGNECKELLAIVDRDFNGTPTVTVDSPHGFFEFTITEEEKAVASYGVPQKGMFLYEPSPSAMKAGGFKLMSARFPGMMKLAPDTHLYISDRKFDNFPGRCYQIAEVESFSSSGIKNFSRRWEKIDITSRNFPVNSAELTKKLKVKPSGELRGFFTTLSDKSKIIVIGHS